MKARWRIGLRGAMVLVGLAALATWLVLIATSPTRRLAGRLTAASPAYERRDAAAMLGSDRIPSWERRRAVKELIGALDDENPQVRMGALLGLDGRGADALPALPRVIELAADPGPAGHVRFSAVALLVALWEPAPPADRARIERTLRGHLDDPAPIVCVKAAEGLLATDEDAALVALVRVRASGDEMAGAMADSVIRRARLRNRRVDAVLLREVRGRDPAVRLATLELILELSPPETIRAALRAAATDADPEVRRYAAEKLRAIGPADGTDAPPSAGF